MANEDNTTNNPQGIFPCGYSCLYGDIKKVISMKKQALKLCAFLLAALLLLASCGKSGTSHTSATSASTSGTTASGSSSATSGTVVAPEVKNVKISEDELYDKLVGGWLGQMVGVSWSASTEFRWCGQIIPEGGMDTWTPSMINNAFGQDDIYVEIPFLDAMKENGAMCPVSYMADKFRDSAFPLWHANKYGRDNLLAGIEYPDSGHYLYNPCADDIDWQIESDFLGMMYPGLVSVAAARSFDVGHIMNYGDGVYGGVFVSAMHAAAFTAESMDEIVAAGLAVIPDNTKFKSLMLDVVASYENGDTWEECWQMLESKWASDDKCIGGSGNIDAKLNAGYVLIGLLWGKGDMAQTIIISCRCGQDSDCNPSTAASILGNFIGADAIEAQYKNGLDKTGRKFSNTNYTFNEVIELNFELMKDILTEYGAVYEDGAWIIQTEESYTPVPWEQWKDAFDVSVNVKHTGNGVVALEMTKYGEEALKTVEIDMGDGKKFDFFVAKYAYNKAGTYTVKWTAVGVDGTTVSHQRKITIKEEVEIEGTPICSVTSPTGGGSKDIRTIFDGVTPSEGTDSSALQYDTYCGGAESDFVYAGIEFKGAYTISGVKFTEGKHFHDGGWFAEAPYIEILTGGEWVKIDTEISKAYPANSLEAQGQYFETYTFTFGKPVDCEGVRISGVPGGKAYFISVGEIAPICENKNDFENDMALPICSITKPEGSGSKDISVICDGAVGTDAKSQYDTYVKTPVGDETYIGYVYTAAKTVTSVEFTEGMHFKDGGWFSGGLRVEILVGGKWKAAETTLSSPYPSGSTKDDFGANFEVYTFTLTSPAECDGVRIIGKAGGTSKFISVSELAVK